MTKADRWYAEVTRYQWLVLIIASAGWVFDAFEGQLYNLTRTEMLADLMPLGTREAQARWGDLFLAVFLVGGTFGGILFGNVADRIGRKPAMAVTILFYSVFSGLTFFATELWHVAILRFLVAMGVGGEWAVAAALVSEVFPQKARAHASGIFHATSLMGIWLAALAGLAVGSQWRYAYLIGILPALLVFAVRMGIRDQHPSAPAASPTQIRGSFRELFGDRRWAKPAILGLLLASVGLGTFWGVTVAGQDLTRRLLERDGMSTAAAAEQAKFAFGFIQMTGGGLGLLSFGPLASRFGRRKTFALMQAMALVVVPLTCYVPQTYGQIVYFLPFYGFFTLGIHAGYAIYFPELFPQRLRATGAGVCFNGGRLLAALILWISAEVKGLPGVELPLAVSLLSLFFVPGILLLLFLPETKDRPLPE